MLAQKNINKKRLFAYIVIMIFMFCGMGFFVYKNYKLSYGGGAKTEVDSALPEGLGERKERTVADTPTQAVTEPPQRSELKILENPQYKVLEDNAVESSIESYTGSENPFMKTADETVK